MRTVKEYPLDFVYDQRPRTHFTFAMVYGVSYMICEESQEQILVRDLHDHLIDAGWALDVTLPRMKAFDKVEAAIASFEDADFNSWSR